MFVTGCANAGIHFGEDHGCAIEKQSERRPHGNSEKGGGSNEQTVDHVQRMPIVPGAFFRAVEVKHVHEGANSTHTGHQSYRAGDDKRISQFYNS